MSHEIIITGDCNTATFQPFCDRIRANQTVGPITMNAFCRDNSSYFQRLVAFLSSVNTINTTLVFCVSKIDLKTQFWRDIPLLSTRGMPLEEYVRQRTTAFVNQLERVLTHFQFRRVILFGAPGSLLTDVPHNDEFPTVGSNATRNALTHLFNLEFIRSISSGHPRIGFATLFYHMISPSFETIPECLPDGMHVPSSQKEICMGLLAPVVSGNTQFAAGQQIVQMQSRSFQISEIPATFTPGRITTPYFQSWLQVAKDGQMEWNGKQFALRSYQDIGANGTELALI